MSWLLLALLAHLINALVFILDKGILSADSKISNPLSLAFYSGLISALSFLLLPLDYQTPNSFIIIWSAVAGLLFVGALYFFYTALKHGESSRVVPLIGSAVPIFTIIFANFFLQEQLQMRELLGVGLLIIGGALLSLRLRDTVGLSAKTVIATIIGGAAFAGYFAVVKYMYANFESFWAAFAYSRLGVAVMALVVLGPFVWQLYRRPTKKKVKKQKPQKKLLAMAFFSSKALGTVGFILQNYAISLGSVSIVNALQGTQYLFVFLLAAILSYQLPKLFSEELHRVALIQKLVGIGTIIIGFIVIL